MLKLLLKVLNLCWKCVCNWNWKYNWQPSVVLSGATVTFWDSVRSFGVCQAVIGRAFRIQVENIEFKLKILILSWKYCWATNFCTIRRYSNLLGWCAIIWGMLGGDWSCILNPIEFKLKNIEFKLKIQILSWKIYRVLNFCTTGRSSSALGP